MNRTAGFTFLEVMIALAILALVLVAAFQNQAQSVSMGEEARYLTHAALLAREKTALLESPEGPAGESETGTWEEPFEDFYWKTAIEETEISGVKKITVTVGTKKESFNPYTLVWYRYEGM